MPASDPTYYLLHKYTRVLLQALGYRDATTRLHSERVLYFAEMLGTACGLQGPALSLLKISAAFHDIGKIGVRDTVLLKPASLQAHEWAIMRQHAEIGERIMDSTQLVGARQAALDIRHHHERFNGEGYPDRLQGSAIPLNSRIISVVDSFDAMTKPRPYRGAMTPSQAQAAINSEAGKMYDPDIVFYFNRLADTGQLVGPGIPVEVAILSQGESVADLL